MNFIPNTNHKTNKNFTVLIASVVTILLISLGSISDVIAQQENTVITVTLNSENYKTGQTLEIQGIISDVKMPVIALTIYDPNGKTLQASNLDITNNTFTKTIPLDSPFYDKAGQYAIKLSYGKTVQEIFFEILGASDNTPQNEPSKPEPEPAMITSLVSVKSTYYDGDTVVISGTVSSTVDPTILIGIHDPFGSPTGFYFGMINDNAFTVSFMVKSGVNFKADGTYYAKAHYGESEKKVEFDFSKDTEIEKVQELEPAKTEQQSKTESKSNTDVKTNPEKTEPKQQLTQTNQENPDELKQETVSEPRKTDKNLTVEDIELGIMLNQINLECDVEKVKDLTSYYDGIGPSLSRLCKYSEAIPYYLDDLKDNPKDVDVLTNLGSAFFHLGYYSDSLREYDTALSISPNNVFTLNNKANLLSKTGMDEDAMELYLKASKISPTNTIIKRNMMITQSSMQSQINDIPMINQTTVNDNTFANNTDSATSQDMDTKNNTSRTQNVDSVSDGGIFSEILSAILSFFNPSE